MPLPVTRNESEGAAKINKKMGDGKSKNS